MTLADSVSIFAEGTFEEQIRELVNYIARGKSEEEQTKFIAPFSDALITPEGGKPIEEDESRRKAVVTDVLVQVTSLGNGTEKEIEGFFNLLYSHFLSLYAQDAPETKERLAALLESISSSPGDASTKYRVLSNLFNALDRRSALRITVYTTLLDLASANDELDILQINKAEVERWLSEWDIPQEDKSAFLKRIADAFSKADEPTTSYEFTLAYVRSLPASSPERESAAVHAIATALQLPSVFDFDALFALDAVLAAKAHPLFALLQIFLNGGLDDYRTWASANADALAAHITGGGAQLERKIRLLTLASLAFENVGRDLPYAKIASALQIDVDDVERWVIDVIRAGLVSGKLSQTTQTLHIARATARTFERTQWEALEQRLLAWKSGLASVLDVVTSAQKTSGGNKAVASTSETVNAPQTAAVGA